MRVLFAGTPEAAVPSLRALLGSPHEVVAVLTRPDAPSGRGRRLQPSPVAEVALEEGLDTGPVFGVVTETIHPTDTAGDLLGRLAESGAGLLVATLDGIEAGALVPVAQSGDVSLAPKITPEDARVRWTDPAMRVDRLVRGCTPAPGAWCEFRGERVKLGPVRPAAEVTDLAPGELRVVKSAIWAGTATHAVLLGEVKAEGKRMMPAADWARGVRVEPGECLG
jgi:methionyl-tRNA formyltransferase